MTYPKKMRYSLAMAALICLSFFQESKAQDTIKAINGDLFIVQVEEIGVDAVRFKYKSNIQGPSVSLPNAELHSVIFENGSVHVFKTLTNTRKFSLGQFYEGGYIFYIDSDGEHGLIAAPAPIAGIFRWGQAQKRLGANNKFDGRPNTEAIVKLGAEGSAAHECANHTSGGYSDWYLPAIKELERLYENKDKIPYFKDLGRSVGRRLAFCSSTEHVNRNDCMIVVDFLYTGRTKFYNKRDKYHVYPIRKF